MPLDHIYFFTAEFLGDVLDSDAAQPETRTNSINSLLAGTNSNLTPVARFASQGFDLHRAVEYLRDLQFKQAPEQILMRPRHYELSPFGSAQYLHKVEFEPLPHPVMVCGHLLSQR